MFSQKKLVVVTLLFTLNGFAESFADLRTDAQRFLNNRPGCSKANVLYAKKLKNSIVYVEPTQELEPDEELAFLAKKKKVIRRLSAYLRGCPDYKEKEDVKKPTPVLTYEEASTKTSQFLAANPEINNSSAGEGYSLYYQVKKSRDVAINNSPNNRQKITAKYEPLLNRLTPYLDAFKEIIKERDARKRATKAFQVTAVNGTWIYQLNEANNTYYPVAKIKNESNLKSDTRKVIRTGKIQAPNGGVTSISTPLRGGLFMTDYHVKLGLTEQQKRDLNKAKIFILSSDVDRKSNIDPSQAKESPRYYQTVVAGRSSRQTLRVMKRVYDKKNKEKVFALVASGSVSKGSSITIDLNNVLTAARYVKGSGRIGTTSKPYFRVRTSSGFKYLHFSALPKQTIIRAKFNESLPNGARKLPFNFKWNSYNPKGTWSHYMAQTLMRSENRYLIDRGTSDVTKFCANFHSLNQTQKLVFWVALMNQIAQRESNYNPFTASDEGFFDKRLEGVISSGISQISLKSVQSSSCYMSRGCESIITQNDLFNPRKNLSCAAAIWSCQIEKADCISCKRDGRWKGIASYWSPMQRKRLLDCNVRNCKRGFAEVGFREVIRSQLRKRLPFCR